MEDVIRAPCTLVLASAAKRVVPDVAKRRALGRWRSIIFERKAGGIRVAVVAALNFGVCLVRAGEVLRQLGMVRRDDRLYTLASSRSTKRDIVELEPDESGRASRSECGQADFSSTWSPAEEGIG